MLDLQLTAWNRNTMSLSGLLVALHKCGIVTRKLVLQEVVLAGVPRRTLPSQYQLFIVIFSNETAADLTRASKLDSIVIMAEN